VGDARTRGHRRGSLLAHSPANSSKNAREYSMVSMTSMLRLTSTTLKATGSIMRRLTAWQGALHRPALCTQPRPAGSRSS
jgi:hypothetical protein